MINRWALVTFMLLGCGTATNTTGTSADPDSGVASGGNGCNEACAAQARASCSAFQMGMCVSGCQAQYATYPACTAQINALAGCAATATWTCSASNRPTATSCNAVLMAFAQCVAADAGP